MNLNTLNQIYNKEAHSNPVPDNLYLEERTTFQGVRTKYGI
jgi:hypothetical protein